MKLARASLWRALFLLAVGSLFGLGLGAPADGAQRGARTDILPREAATAVSGLERSRELATRWQPDVELRKVYADSVTSEGAASEDSGWTFVFYSKHLRRSYEVSVSGPMTLGAEGSNPESLAALGSLPKDFTDSDKALTVARESGFRANSSTRMTLAKRADEPATWEITSGTGSYFVDAESGKFLRVKE